MKATNDGICKCGHKESEHTGEYQKGSCLVPECPCRCFTWARIDKLEEPPLNIDGPKMNDLPGKPVLRIECVLAGPDPQMGNTPAAVLHSKDNSSRWILEDMGYDEHDQPPSDVVHIGDFVERMRKAALSLNADFEIDEDMDEFLEELRNPDDDEDE